jgi:hypothetical protein
LGRERAAGAPPQSKKDAVFMGSLYRARLRFGPKQATIQIMFLAIFAMRVLEAMFFLGLAGSTLVVIISFIEDAKELFGAD